jgi:hypothetical protein
MHCPYTAPPPPSPSLPLSLSPHTRRHAQGLALQCCYTPLPSLPTLVPFPPSLPTTLLPPTSPFYSCLIPFPSHLSPAHTRRARRAWPLVPTGAGALVAPPALCDPRSAPLAAVFDPRAAMPAPPFSSDPFLLSALAALGMRTAADLPALAAAAEALGEASDRLEARRAAARAARQAQHRTQRAAGAVGAMVGGAAAAPRGGQGAGVEVEGEEEEEQDAVKEAAAVAGRARELLRLLDAAARAAAPRPRPAGQGQGAQGQAGGHAEEERRLWAHVSNLKWCPVLQEPPEPGGWCGRPPERW